MLKQIKICKNNINYTHFKILHQLTFKIQISTVQ